MYDAYSKGTYSSLLVSVTDKEVTKTETSFLVFKVSDICLHIVFFCYNYNT